MASTSDSVSDASSSPSKTRATSETAVLTVVTEDKPADEVIAGSWIVQLCCLILLLAGLGELISGSLVISLTHGRYIGGVYVGIAAIFAGLRGLFLKHGVASLLGTLIFSFLAVIISLVGTILQAKMFSFITTLKACATNALLPTTQCNTASSVYYTCYGATEAFNAAYVCARDSYTYSTNTNGNNNDDYSSPGAILCGCVSSSQSNPIYSSTSSNNPINTDDYLQADDFITINNANSLATTVDSAACHAFREFDSCDTILTQVPRYLQIAYLFSVACVLLAAVVCLLCVLLFTRPQWFQFRYFQFQNAKNNKNNKSNDNRDVHNLT